MTSPSDPCDCDARGCSACAETTDSSPFSCTDCGGEGCSFCDADVFGAVEPGEDDDFDLGMDEGE